jgi:SAM-dependent methyltransferase
LYQNVTGTDQFFKGVDVFDHFHENHFSMEIFQAPTSTIALGLDHKDTLIAKANRLGSYENTIVSGANKTIPLANGSVSMAFCNILYLLEYLYDLFSETHRILRADGRFMVQLPERRAEEVMVNHLYGKHRWEWARLIDRNKYATTYPRYHEHERAYWDELLEKAGFRVATEVELSPNLVHLMWDIGLRPLFSAPMKMCRRLADVYQREVKKVWLDTLYEVLVHFCDPDWMYGGMGCKPTYRMAALEKI